MKLFYRNITEDSERNNLTLYISYIGSNTANNETLTFSDGEDLTTNVTINSGLLGNSSIAAGAPLVHRWHKKFISRLNDPMPLSDEEIDEGFLCYDTDDFQIGYKAFLSKTMPEFTGH